MQSEFATMLVEGRPTAIFGGNFSVPQFALRVQFKAKLWGPKETLQPQGLVA